MDVMLEMKISTRSQRKVKSLLNLSAPQDVQPAQVGGRGGPNPERVLQMVLLVVSPKPDQRSFSPVCSWSLGSPALGVLLSFCHRGGNGFKRWGCRCNRLMTAGGAGALARIAGRPEGPGARAHPGSMTHNYHGNGACKRLPAAPALR